MSASFRSINSTAISASFRYINYDCYVCFIPLHLLFLSLSFYYICFLTVTPYSKHSKHFETRCFVVEQFHEVLVFRTWTNGLGNMLFVFILSDTFLHQSNVVFWSIICIFCRVDPSNVVKEKTLEVLYNISCQCCRSGMFIPNPGTKLFHPRFRIQGRKGPGSPTRSSNKGLKKM